MSVNVSVRLDDSLAERLRKGAATAGETMSGRLRRYVEEGSRQDEHPMVVFRDGPSGRRAGIIAGPDVWEVAMWLDDAAQDGGSTDELVLDGLVTRRQADAAQRYRAEYSDEIDARIALHRVQTASADRA